MIEFLKTLSPADWVGLIGGLSGLISSGAYFYDRLTSGPKVISKINYAKVYERSPSQTDQLYNYDFTIEIEIGNIGTKLTSILKPKLEIYEIPASFELQFPDNAGHPLQLSRTPAIALEAGFANAFIFRCNYRCEKKLEISSFTGNLKLKQNGEKDILHGVVFEAVDRWV